MFYKVLLLCVLSIASISADENAGACALNCQKTSSAVSQILTEQSDSIQYFDGERLYLKAERIFPTDTRLLLCNGHSSILLPELLTDQRGYYLPCVKKCPMKCANPNCGYCCWDAYRDGILCPVCEYPGDPY